tara:strand:- start:283 stop:1068 length:786 start_codon:yes stop_codon:yes gene_type:complete
MDSNISPDLESAADSIREGNDWIVYPVTVCDNFYEDPDSVREFALSLDYTNKIGIHPGLRSQCISTINKEFYEISYHKILSMYGDYSQTCDPTNYGCYSYFQKIWRFSGDPKDPVNGGWIHNDGLCFLAAVIYLDPDPLNDNGTSVYHMDYDIPKEEKVTIPNKEPQWYNDILGEEDICGVDSLKHYRKEIVKSNDRFSLTTEVKNRYNRSIIYSGAEWHGQTSYYMPSDDDFRLTQVFFFFDLSLPPTLVPKLRCKSYGI